ncbi:MAG: hypothetical protein M3Q66_03570, partial [Chloroflexota bacterium]|nr:hypothetical protein [Chloroflexota bacterium]
VAWSFTTDGGTRIWNGAGSRVDLVTTIDVDPPGGDTRIVEVVDYSRRVLNVRAATAGDLLRWQPVGPEAAGWRLDIATGSTSRELAVRWHANRCQTDWELHVRVDGGFGPGPFVLPTTMGLEACAEDPVARAIVLAFDRPIDLDTVTTSDNTSGG